jgi:hypothetical protein
MKKIPTFLKVVIIILLVIIAAVSFFFIRNSIFLGGTDKKNVAYLSTHQLVIDKNENILPEASFFSAGFDAANVYLLGEVHGFGDVQALDLQLLKLLHSKGVRYYIAEMDSLQAKQLNKFLLGEEKDTFLLKEVVQKHKSWIPQQAGRQFYEKWLSVYDFNHSLPDSLRITVLGLDKIAGDTVNTGISRDSAMMFNFRQLVQEKGLQNEKFYGLFGYFHVLQSMVGENNSRPFAARLKQSGVDVKSITIYTIAGKMYLPKGLGIPTPEDEQIGISNADGPIMLVKGIKDLKAAAGTQNITLFNLEADQSPYRNGQRLARVKSTMFGDNIEPSDKETPSTEFFQYVVLLQQSPAMMPLY